MALIKAAETKQFEFNGVRFTGLAAPSRGATENAVWRVVVPAGSISATSHQVSREEVLVALHGNAVARLGDEVQVFAAGDVLIIPAFTDFTLDNPGKAPFEAMTVLPVGGRAILPGAAPFVPPWAQ